MEPRVVAYALILGGGAATTMVMLALYLPYEGFLALLFPSFFLWILLPFILLRLWKRLTTRREG